MVALGLSAACTAAASDAQTDSDAAVSSDGSLEEVLVTAQRRSENLQHAAVAVSAITAEALASAGVQDAQDLTRIVPALNISSIAGSGTQVSIRGVGNFAGNAYAEQAVAMNLDGVYLSRPAAVSGLFYDLERVEVLKGPQGTLYGRNATAGAVNIISKRPVDELQGEASVELGNYETRRVFGMLNVPLGATTAVRAAIQTSRRDGYLSDGYDDDDGKAGRISLKSNPTENLSLLLSADYAKQDGKGQTLVFTPFVNPADPYTGPSTAASNAIFSSPGLPPILPRIGSDGFLDNRFGGVAGTVDWSTNAGTLTIIPAWRSTHLHYLHYAAGFPVSDDETSNQKSLEARFVSAEDQRARWVIGAYAFREDIDFAILANQGVTSSLSDIPDLESRTAAAFGQATFDLTHTLRLVGGVRYTRDDKSQSGTRTSPLPQGPPPAVACPSPASVVGSNCVAPVEGDASWSKVTWKAGIEADLSDKSLLYFNVGTGYRAGGFFPSLAPNTFDPEKLFAVTLGSKNRFLADSLQFNAEAYYWKYKDKQTTHIGPVSPAGFELITENAGDATIYGVDTETSWLVSESDRLTLQLQYEHSSYDDFVYNQYSAPPIGPPVTACPATPNGAITVVNCSGRPLPLAPEWAATLGYQRTFRFSNGARLVFGADSRLESAKWLANEYVPGEYQGSFHRTNASLTFDAPSHWSISAYVRNIEDEAVKASTFVQPVLGVPLVSLLPPRTYGVQLTAEF
jgi:iron complex outermembrane receptor protein